MRLLLDHQLSGRRIAGPLQAAGHDVRALHGEPRLAGMADRDVLALASADGRIVVTRNAKHFAPLAREWASLSREHAGIILIWSLDHGEFAAIVSGVERQLATYPTQEAWRDLVVAF
ncbi:MAG: DUF5615 family PIN-like protein [Gaiellaceae bacterium]